MTGEELPQTGALRGVTVVEFGQYIPGPLLGMLLADQGADVVKIERPTGDPARSEPAFATWNRGKRSVVLDLKRPEEQQRARRLAASADVLIENFRPGVMDRLGLGFEALSDMNPRLIYCSLPGFPAWSPYRQDQGWDAAVAATTGVHRPAVRGGDPVFMPLPLPSTFAALLGAISVTGALFARGRTGRGQRLEVPLHDAMFTTMGRDIVLFHDSPLTDPRFLPILPMSAQYRCADGRYFQLHGTFERFVRTFLTVAGRPEWIEDAVDFLLNPGDAQEAQLWQQRFAEVMSERSAAEWEDAIAMAGGAGGICRSVDEWLEHPHARAAGLVLEVEDRGRGPMKQLGLTVNLRGTPGSVRRSAPLLGEHTEEVLTSAEAAATANGQPDPGGLAPTLRVAFEGIRVLDLCIILAGPTAGRTMAEFGADVVKIDDPARPYNIFASVDVNRGKRSMLLDLRHEEGRRILWELIATADVVIENFRKGKLERLGLGYEDVRARRPDIIYASLNAYGHDGPWAGRPGWEQLAQAVSGMQVRRGGRGAPPRLMPYPIDDYGTGLIGAYGIALALLERQRTGRGQRLDASLTAAACLFQSPYYLDHAGYQRNDPEGLELRGRSALSRLYQAADGWMFVEISGEAAWQRLTGLPEFAALAAERLDRPEDDAGLAAALGRILAQRERAFWIPRLRAAGIAAVENRTLEDIQADERVRQAGLIVTRDHPGIGPVDHTGGNVWLSDTPTTLGRPSPILGADTAAILAELGYSGCS